MRMHFRAIGVDNCHQITKQAEPDFILLFQRALLLGLKEAGRLNEMQHRQAESILIEQHREYIRKHVKSFIDD